MTKYVIERYAIFNTKGCPYDIISGNFNYQHIPSNYYNILNDDNDDGNNIPGNPVDDALLDKKGVKYAIAQNDEDTNDEIMINNNYSLVPEIDPLQN